MALLSTSLIARLPLAMLSISLLVYAKRLTGSFAIAGLVSGGYTVGLGVSGPSLGRLADRRGQLSVLLATATASAVLLAVMALLPAAAPRPLLVGLAAGVGLATPPLNGCVRALLPEVVLDAQALPAAYAVESPALELTFISGPPLALGLAALWTPRAALACAGLILPGCDGGVRDPASLTILSACSCPPAATRWLAAVTGHPHPRRRPDRGRCALWRHRGRCYRGRNQARQHGLSRAAARAVGRRIAGRRRGGQSARPACRAQQPEGLTGRGQASHPAQRRRATRRG